MKKLIFYTAFLMGISAFGQEEGAFQAFLDSMMTQELDEVLLISNSTENYLKDNKALGSIDSYLAESKSVNMIKRGAYAWEPMLNGMATERSIVTVDGMRIYAACTDKMDPVTSYVENTNLSKAKISDGASGATHGGTIAGSIDLERRRTGFKSKPETGGTVFSGLEGNNLQQIYGGSFKHSQKKVFVDLDFTYRDAENYRAGKKSGQKREVDYSQFTKYNLSAITGVKLADQHELEASAIFDRATDVGYPGLPMDVSKAQALIASMQYVYRNPTEHIDRWETKAYFNTVTHVMDDSYRPEVPIRMDMPGWSKTQGFYSKLNGQQNKHRWAATLSAHRNNSLAEMTMFPNDPNEPNMFMLTWPDVNTLYGGIDLEDQIQFNPHLRLNLKGGIGIHHNKIRSEAGLSSLQIFYPDLEPEKTRVLKNLSSRISFHHGHLTHQLGIGYGERAASVSEAYGFYLLNTNDNYDYVGNPNMKNEKSLNMTLSTAFDHRDFQLNWQASYFYMMDYIIGKPREGVPPMNILADGIKVYEQLDAAQIFNTNLGMSYFLTDFWTLTAGASYRYGQGKEQTRLPLIQPFTYSAGINFEKNQFYAKFFMEGSTRNRNSIEFGETQKTGYWIANLALSQVFDLQENSLAVKLGVENMFDRYYSTFDDWFGIPRMGRNVYANVIFKW